MHDAHSVERFFEASWHFFVWTHQRRFVWLVSGCRRISHMFVVRLLQRCSFDAREVFAELTWGQHLSVLRPVTHLTHQWTDPPV